MHSSLLNTLQRVMSYLATTDSIFYWISRSTSRTKTQPVQFNLIVSHRKCSLQNGKYRHAKAGSSGSKTRLRRKNPQWSAFNVPRMTCSLNLWLIMQKVHNFYGISCSGNWKLRVTTVWENRQLSFFLFFTAENNAYYYGSVNSASFLSAHPLCFVCLLSLAVHNFTDDLNSNTRSVLHNNLVLMMSHSVVNVKCIYLNCFNSGKDLFQ